MSGNVTSIFSKSDIDPDSIHEEALAEIWEERSKKAKKALKAKLQARIDAEQIVENLNREIEDLKVQIKEGTFE